MWLPAVDRPVFSCFSGPLGVSLYGIEPSQRQGRFNAENRFSVNLSFFKISTCLIALCAFALIPLGCKTRTFGLLPDFGAGTSQVRHLIYHGSSWGLKIFRKTVSRSLFVKLLGVLMYPSGSLRHTLMSLSTPLWESRQT